MMQPYYYSPYQPPEYSLSVFERKKIRKHYSSIALILIVSEFASVIVCDLIYSIGTLMGYKLRYDDDGNLVMNIFAQIYGYIGLELALVLVAMIVYLIKKWRWRDVFRTDKLSFEKIMLTVLVSLGLAQFSYIIAIVVDLMYSVGGYEMNIGVADPDTTAGWAFDFFTSVVTAPIAEEIIYRGVIMRSFSQVSKRFAIFASALVFGFIHGNPAQFFLAFFVGLVFAYADIKMCSIIPSIIAHMSVNLVATLHGYVPEDMYFLVSVILMVLLITTGVIAFIFTKKKYGIDFTKSDIYHKLREIPVMVRSVPCWIIFIYYVYDVMTAYTRIK